MKEYHLGLLQQFLLSDITENPRVQIAKLLKSIQELSRCDHIGDNEYNEGDRQLWGASHVTG